LCLIASSGVGQGIPEPDLVLYGTIVNVRNNANIRLAYGPLTWVFQASGGGAPVTVSTVLTNINHQFSYIMRIPCETAVGGFSLSANTIQLTALPGLFDRSQVTWYSNVLTFVQPSQATTTISTADRGRIERVDLTVSSPSVFDVNGLPIDWEMLYFGRLGIDPFADPDGDGLTNLAEYLAGTDPTTPNSALRFTGIRADAGFIHFDWLSSSNQIYVVQRSLDLATGFADIATGIAATPPLNSYTDSNNFGAGPVFYRLRLGP